MGMRILLASGSALALATAHPAIAQDAGTQPGTSGPTTGNQPSGPDAKAQDNGKTEDGLGQIVVTATRQATNLQDTPIAITAATANQLEDRGVTTISDLTAVVPNAQFQKTQGAFGPGVSGIIRGIGSGDTNIGGENAVAYYIDGIYYPLVLGANFDLLDIDHIEVLRGPQGTLFGRNALAGAVNIVARQPSTTEATGYADVTVGSYNRLDLRAGFNLPIGKTAALMVSGLSKNREGYVRILDFTCQMYANGTPALAGTYPTSDVLKTNQPNFTANDCTIGHLGGENVHGGKATFLWEPTSSIKLTASADYIRDKSENTPDHVVAVTQTGGNSNIQSEAGYFGLTFDNRFVTGDPFTTFATYTDEIPAGTVIPGNGYYNGTFVNGRYTRGGYVLDPHISIKNWGVSGKLDWDLGGNMNLTAVYGHRNLREYHAYDTDGTPLVAEHTVNDNSEKYDNAEVRLSGKSDLIDWVAGLFYFKSFGDQHAAIISPQTSGQKSLHTTYDSLSKAVFANATVRPFGEKFSISLGGRYSDDRKIVDFSNLSDTSPSGADIIFHVVPAQKKFNWKAGLNYQPNHDLLLYASAATGNSLPGYNSRPLQKTQVTQFDGQDDIAYEVGAKMDLLHRRVRLNLAAFYTDFRTRPAGISGAEALLDAQTGAVVPGNQQLEPLPGGPAGSTRCSTTNVAPGTGITCIGRTYYINVPASVRGFEAEYTINPIEGLIINGSVGWSKFLSPDIEARTVNARQSNPFWTANAGIQYEIPTNMLHGSITPRLDWTFQSSQISSGTSTTYNYLTPARSLFNARITYRNDDYDFSVAVGATNLFNKFYYVNVFDYQAFGYPTTDAQPGEPREWYLTVSKHF